MRRVLAVVLVLWEPLTLALAASTLLRRITEHGVPAYAVLVVKVFVAGVGIAAGMALWQERPGAMVLARWALALSLATTLFSRLTRLLAGDAAAGSSRPGARRERRVDGRVARVEPAAASVIASAELKLGPTTVPAELKFGPASAVDVGPSFSSGNSLGRALARANQLGRATVRMIFPT